MPLPIVSAPSTDTSGSNNLNAQKFEGLQSAIGKPKAFIPSPQRSMNAAEGVLKGANSIRTELQVAEDYEKNVLNKPEEEFKALVKQAVTEMGLVEGEDIPNIDTALSIYKTSDQRATFLKSIQVAGEIKQKKAKEQPVRDKIAALQAEGKYQEAAAEAQRNGIVKPEDGIKLGSDVQVNQSQVGENVAKTANVIQDTTIDAAKEARSVKQDAAQLNLTNASIDEKKASIQKTMLDVTGSAAKAERIHKTVVKPFDDAVAEHEKYQMKYQQLQTGLDAKNGAGDLTAIFGFMKQLDPPSTVREGEQASVAAIGGTIEQIKATIGKVQGEGSLSQVSRDQLSALAKKLAQQEQELFENRKKYYRSRAENMVEGGGEVFDKLHPSDNTKNPGASRGKIDAGTATEYMKRAGGDKNKARELAKADGWEF